MILDIPFTVVDIETTGSRAGFDRIIEVGAVNVQHGKIIRSFDALVNPGCDIPPIITGITGITNSMVRGAPSFLEIAEGFKNFIGESVFVAHNAVFDYRFVRNEFTRIGDSAFQNPYLCSVKLARRVFPGLLHYNLGSLCTTLRIPLKRAHRAGEDAMATAHLLVKMLKRLVATGFGELDRFSALYRNSLPREERRYSAKYSSKGRLEHSEYEFAPAFIETDAGEPYRRAS